MGTSEKHKTYMQKYRKTEKGKSQTKKYQSSEKYKAYKRKYAQSAAFKASLKKYQQSEKGKTTLKKGFKKYKQSEKGKIGYKASQKKYFQSEKGKAALKRYRQSEKGKAFLKGVSQSAAFKASQKKYQKSEKGKLSLKKGRANWYYKNYHKPEVKKMYQASYKKWFIKKYNSDPAFRLMNQMRSRLRKFLRLRRMKKNNTTRELIGCDPGLLRKHLEKQFFPNPRTGEIMTWKNHSTNGWHVDHIKPLASFDYESDPDVLKKACHYSNLQPLWAKENLRKRKF